MQVKVPRTLKHTRIWEARERPSQTWTRPNVPPLFSLGSDASTIEIHITGVSRNGNDVGSVPKAQGDL